MVNMRTMEIIGLPAEGSVKDLNNLTSNILLKYPNAMIQCDYDNQRYVTIQVDKTELDLQIEVLENKLKTLPHAYTCNNVSPRVVVINQNTPIPDDVLEAIKADGKSDKYWLHFNGCVLERYLTETEKEELEKQTKETRKKHLLEREIIEKELSKLYRLQREQDRKYEYNY